MHAAHSLHVRHDEWKSEFVTCPLPFVVEKFANVTNSTLTFFFPSPHKRIPLPIKINIK
jgi:hypothetical protein